MLVAAEDIPESVAFWKLGDDVLGCLIVKNLVKRYRLVSELLVFLGVQINSVVYRRPLIFPKSGKSNHEPLFP